MAVTKRKRSTQRSADGNPQQNDDPKQSGVKAKQRSQTNGCPWNNFGRSENPSERCCKNIGWFLHHCEVKKIRIESDSCMPIVKDEASLKEPDWENIKPAKGRAKNGVDLFAGGDLLNTAERLVADKLNITYLKYLEMKKRIIAGFAIVIEQNIRLASGKLCRCHPSVSKSGPRISLTCINIGKSQAQMLCKGHDANVASALFDIFSLWQWIPEELQQRRVFWTEDEHGVLTNGISGMFTLQQRKPLFESFQNWERDLVSRGTFTVLKRQRFSAADHYLGVDPAAVLRWHTGAGHGATAINERAEHVGDRFVTPEDRRIENDVRQDRHNDEDWSLACNTQTTAQQNERIESRREVDKAAAVRSTSAPDMNRGASTDGGAATKPNGTKVISRRYPIDGPAAFERFKIKCSSQLKSSDPYCPALQRICEESWCDVMDRRRKEQQELRERRAGIVSKHH